jgi:fumarate reductase flavoprotein subunit
MYKYHTPSGDKSCDGLAMVLRAGLPLRDLEMVQFHPTGLLAGPHTRMTGTVLEEGLRGSGGHLLNGGGERFMLDYAPRAERATRDIVSRAMFAEMRAGRTTPHGGLYISMAHLGPENVRREFKGMVERCADCGFDLAGERVEVVPTAHYMMGGVEFGLDCRTELDGLFAAGEDTGGVHGANRLGGNGVANSTVFGGVAGDAVGEWLATHAEFAEPDRAAIDGAAAAARHPLEQPAGDLLAIRESLYEVMWNDVGIVRDGPGLQRALGLLESLHERLRATGVSDATLRFNLAWHDWLNLDSLLRVSRAIAYAALAREESRGAHWREDFPQRPDLGASAFTRIRFDGRDHALEFVPVAFTRVRPGATLLTKAAA